MPRTNLAALFAISVVTLTVAACAALGPLEGTQAQPAQCYWLSNVTNQWQPMPDVETRQQCFELDSCSGGLGYSGGGCYKWAVAANDPFKRW